MNWYFLAWVFYQSLTWLKKQNLPAPFIIDMKPSFFMICIAQSTLPLYLTACPEVIIILLRIVSIG